MSAIAVIVMVVMFVALGASVHISRWPMFLRVPALIGIAVSLVIVLRGTLSARARSRLPVEKADGSCVIAPDGVPRVFSRRALTKSLVLRTELRAMYGLRVCLGDDSPELRDPSDPPHALWRTAPAMPSAQPGERMYREHAVVLVATTQPAADAARVRLEADDFTTVVDEAVFAGDSIVVREGNEVGELDMKMFRGELSPVRGMATFLFGKATKVFFVDDNNDVVEAFRERLARERTRDDESFVEALDVDKTNGPSARRDS